MPNKPVTEGIVKDVKKNIATEIGHMKNRLKHVGYISGADRMFLEIDLQEHEQALDILTLLWAENRELKKANKVQIQLLKEAYQRIEECEPLKDKGKSLSEEDIQNFIAKLSKENPNE